MRDRPLYIARALTGAIAFVLVAVIAPPTLGSGVAQASAAAVGPSGVSASVQGLNVAVSWTAASAAGVSGYVVSTVPESPVVEVPAGASSAVLIGIRPTIAYSVRVAARSGDAVGSTVPASGTVTTVAPGGSFTPLTPDRILDTRIGLGAAQRSTQSVDLQVVGRGGIPAGGVGSVALNVTVTGPVTPGFVTAFPTGQQRPLASNLNYDRGQDVANLVIVPVGAGGKVSLYSSAATHLVVDVAGFFSTTQTAAASRGLFQSVQPARLMDTRLGLGSPTLEPAQTVTLKVVGTGGVPLAGVTAVALNTTVTEPTGSGFLTAFPTGSARPGSSIINFRPGQTVANRIIVPVGPDGTVSLFNSEGRTQLVVDVTGWFTDGSDASAGGAYYVGVTPTRLVDTRTGTGVPAVGPVSGGTTVDIPVAGRATVPASTVSTPPTGAVLTVTLVRPVEATYATVSPSMAERPYVSDVNAAAGQDVPNVAVAGLGVDGAVDVFVAIGRLDVVVDLSGYFIGAIHIPSSTVTAAPGAISAVTGDPATGVAVTLAAGTTVPGVGQIITSGVTATTPAGLLAQVTAVTTAGDGSTVLTTTPATLQQAVGTADFAVKVPLSADDVTAAVPGLRGPGSALTEVIGPAQINQRVAAAGQTPVKNKRTVNCQGDAKSAITTDFSITAALIFEADLAWKDFQPTVTARAGAEISQVADVTIAFNAKASCSWAMQLMQFTFRPVSFTVGPVPVVVVPVFTVKLDASATGTATLSTSLHQDFTAAAGIRYDGSAVHPYNTITKNLVYTPPAWSVANVTAKAALTGDLEGRVYGLAGPQVSLVATLTAKADLLANPWWTVKFDLVAEAGLHLDLAVAKLDVSAGMTIYQATLAQAAGKAPGTPPTIVTTGVLPTGTVGSVYSTRLDTVDHRPGNWSITAGSLPAGVTLNGNIISGTPTAAGNAQFTITFTDSTGRTVTGQANILVSASSPPTASTVWAWGFGLTGALGNGGTNNSSLPVQVTGLTDAVLIAAGDNGYALHSNGTVSSWGEGIYGALGNGTTISSLLPVPVTGLTNITAIAGGAVNGYALRGDGTVWAWGWGEVGALGNGTTTNSSVPVQVTGLTDVTAISAGRSTVYALRGDGTVWAWGYGGTGSLGNGGNSNSSVPVQVSELTDVTAISCGGETGYALRTNGTVQAWGDGDFGGLGNGSTASSAVPVQVSGLTDITSIASRIWGGYALRADGTVLAWGYGDNGELGNGSTSRSSVPVQVSGLTGVTAIAGSQNNGYALLGDGTIRAWGNGYWGALGNGSTISSSVPVPVPGLTNVTTIVGGTTTGYALTR